MGALVMGLSYGLGDFPDFCERVRTLSMLVSVSSKPSMASSKPGMASTAMARIHKLSRRLVNIARYGLGEQALERKRAVKNAARTEAFKSERWKHGSSLAQRRYESYEQYLDHQASKLSKIEEQLQETYEADFAEFRRRFADCVPLREARNVLCLAARIGTEVRALHDLGYFAVGIDLNPGMDNTCVLRGDFHHIAFPENSVDAVYCNALDHALDLDRVLGEVTRVLRPEGLFITDLLEGFEEGFTPGNFEAMIWRRREDFIQEIVRRGGFEVAEVRDLGRHRRDHWAQAVFRKADLHCTSPTTT